MNPDRADKLDQIYSAALKLDAGRRAAFVRQACGEDEALQSEIESLLAQEDQLGSFLDKPALEAIAVSMAKESLVGQTLGPYRIEALLGAGGMGEVYRARDTRLGRAVAIKVPAKELTARFLTEARAVAALNHPHVCTLYDIGPNYLVMELVEGDTLAACLSRGPLALPQAIRYAAEIADALEAAHARGIIHRDLKPGNVMVTAVGVIVLDFGLAKLLSAAAGALGTGMPTRSVDRAPRTNPGVVVGTAAYMSPEQARGEELDGRSDLFSLGVVLYEMATGKRPFDGNTNAVIFEAILNRPVKPVREWNPSLPPMLDQIICKALEKDRALRYHRAADLLADLRRLEHQTVTTQTDFAQKLRPETPRIPGRAFLLAGAVAALVLATRFFWPRTGTHPPTVLSQRRITNDGQKKYDLWGSAGFPFTTDGPRIFFNEVIRGTRVIRQVSSIGGEAVAVTGIPDDGGFFPTDSDTAHSSLLLTKLTNECCEMYTMPMVGGSPRRLGDLVGREGVWSPDHQSMAYIGNDHGQDGCIFVARADGHDPRLLVPTNPSIAGSNWLRWSPDGKHLRFTVFDPKTHGSSLWQVSADGTGLHPLLPGWTRPGAECCGSWIANGRYFVFESSHDGQPNIWMLRETPGILRNSSVPVRLTNGPLLYHTPVPSADGKSIYVVGIQVRGESVKFDARLRQFVTLLPGISVGQLDFSRDGAWVAYTKYPDNTLWRSRADGSQRAQLTDPDIETGLPRWSPDGKEIAFAGRIPGKPWSIFTIAASGGDPKQLTTEGLDEAFPDWSPDGTRLAYCRLPWFASTEQLVVRILDRSSGQVTTLNHALGVSYPRWSPDGRYLAASSKSGDNWTIALFDFPQSKWSDLATVQTFVHLAWSRDGRYLYYFDYPPQGPTVFRLRLSNHKIEQVVKVGDMSLLSTDLGTWSLGLAPDDSPIEVRDAGNQELYALEVSLP